MKSDISFNVTLRIDSVRKQQFRCCMRVCKSLLSQVFAELSV